MKTTLTKLGLAALFVAGISGPAIAGQAKPTDSDLQTRIETRFKNSVTLKKFDLSASVDAGVATIKGAVNTAAQKTEAARLAKVTGVTKVDNMVTLDKDAGQTVGQKTKEVVSKTGEVINDAWITTKIKADMVNEDTLKGSDVNVDTNNKVVTLKGTVKSAAGKTRAGVIAKGTEGVTRVVNQLVIK